MKQEDIDVIRCRMERASKTLDEARVLLATGHLEGTVNRAYYSCFYAVSALLLTQGLSTARHSGVLSLFGQHWIATGKLPKELGAVYRRLFDRRQAGDHTDTVAFDRPDVEEWLKQAEWLVSHVKEWIAANAGIQE